MGLQHLKHVIASNYLPAITGRRRTGGTDSARYCYSVWLRHLILAHEHSLPTHVATVAELGPGDSLGIGLAALLTGANRYYAFDVVRYAINERNLTILDELVALFREWSPLPDATEFPQVFPRLRSYEFPHHVLPASRLDSALEPGRVQAIRRALRGQPGDGIAVSYVVPWHSPDAASAGSVDMVFSQAVMEHIDDPGGAYRAAQRWLRPGGFMSHQVDFRSHDYTAEWNGHWACSSPRWRLIRGLSPYLINRLPYSSHVDLINASGFRIVHTERHQENAGITRNQLAREFRWLNDDDLHTFTAFFQAAKD